MKKFYSSQITPRLLILVFKFPILVLYFLPIVSLSHESSFHFLEPFLFTFPSLFYLFQIQVPRIFVSRYSFPFLEI